MLTLCLVIADGCNNNIARESGDSGPDADPYDAGTGSDADKDTGAPASDSGLEAGSPDVSPDSGNPADTGSDGAMDSGPALDGGADAGMKFVKLLAVTPATGGASAGALVTITGEGFGPGLAVAVGSIPAESVTVNSPTSATAFFPPVALKECGPRDVKAMLGGHESLLKSGFTYVFDEDPILFVHGLSGSPKDWDTMIGRFKALGYPESMLAAIEFKDNVGSNIPQARDELPPFVDAFLKQTGASKVDVIAHSMGGLSTRLWIKSYAGSDKVRDYVSLSGTHHGNHEACLTPWWDAAGELCPAYAGKDKAVQWELNGDPDSEDVDETPFGVEEGGGIYWNAMYTDADVIVTPAESGCLDQKSRSDCSSPINTKIHGVGHLQMPTDQGVFDLVVSIVRKHNTSKP